MASTTQSTTKFVNVLILGGLTHVGRSFAHYLVNLPSSEPVQISHIRIVDKYLIAGSASTIYLDPDTIKALEDQRVEYKQANLNTHSTAAKVFEGLNGESYDFVFDLTGEGQLVHDMPPQILLERTTKLTGMLAKLANEKGVKAYIRDTPPFWLAKSAETKSSESFMFEQGEGAETARAYYFYEAERAAAVIDSLPLTILRSANIYGPHQYHGTVTPRIALGEVYAYLKEPLKLLWSSDVRLHTLHSRDWCAAAWKAAIWTSERTRSEANSIAGEKLHYIKPKDVSKIGEVVEKDSKSLDNICPPSITPSVPVFNLADQDDMTQGKILDVIGKVFDIQTGFTNAVINAWAKFNLGSVVDDANEKHAQALAELASKQQPPITYTPLTCYLSIEDLAQRAEALDASKAEKILGWKSKEKFDVENVNQVVKSFRDAGAWVRR